MCKYKNKLIYKYIINIRNSIRIWKMGLEKDFIIYI